ncbi:MAG TPA: hypothetical protein VID68_13755 [Solirubrobacteraceae bacterium]|jgi:hypothetical protein
MSESGASAGLGREHARVHVALTDREARAVVRATALVADLLRPELFRHGGPAVESPLITAHQVLRAACERCGVDLELGSSV